MPAPRTFPVLRILRVWMISALALLAGLGAPARADETVKAVWQVQEIYFPYFGLTTQYSCDSLRDKMRDILKELAVREDMLVSHAGCTELTGPSKNPTLRLIVANAVPADFKPNPEQAAKREDLLAQMQRRSKTPVAGTEPFDAVLRKVTLNSKAGASPGASGDCELLDQVRRQVLPKLGAKVVKDDLQCIPYQGSVSNRKLEVEVLAPVKAN